MQPGLLSERTAPGTLTCTWASAPQREAGAPGSSLDRRKAGRDSRGASSGAGMDTTALAWDKKADQHSWTHWGHTEPSENTLDPHSLQEKRRLSVLFIQA